MQLKIYCCHLTSFFLLSHAGQQSNQFLGCLLFGVVLGVTDTDTGRESLLEVLFPCLLGLILGLTISLHFSTEILECSFVDVLPNSVIPKVDAPGPDPAEVPFSMADIGMKIGVIRLA